MMDEERYPGERQGLTLFLEEIRPIVEEQSGRTCLLYAAIRKALATGTLQNLRHARQIFNLMPRADKQRLSTALVAQTQVIPDQEQLVKPYTSRNPTPFVCFDGDASDEGETAISFRHECLDPQDVQVMVKPGTLPSSAASRLRLIANAIERDRRVLSPRHWATAEAEPSEAEDSACRGQSDCG